MYIKVAIRAYAWFGLKNDILFVLPEADYIAPGYYILTRPCRQF